METHKPNSQNRDSQKNLQKLSRTKMIQYIETHINSKSVGIC